MNLLRIENPTGRPDEPAVINLDYVAYAEWTESLDRVLVLTLAIPLPASVASTWSVSIEGREIHLRDGHQAQLVWQYLQRLAIDTETHHLNPPRPRVDG